MLRCFRASVVSQTLGAWGFTAVSFLTGLQPSRLTRWALGLGSTAGPDVSAVLPDLRGLLAVLGLRMNSCIQGAASGFIWELA